MPHEEETRGLSHDPAQRRFTVGGPLPGPAGPAAQSVPAQSAPAQSAQSAESGTAPALLRRKVPPGRIVSTPPDSMPSFGTPAPGPSAPGASIQPPPPPPGQGPRSSQASRPGQPPAPRTPRARQPAAEPPPSWPDPLEPPGTPDFLVPPDPAALDARQDRHRHRQEHQASYREVFAVGEFRALWAAQVLSYGGDQFAQVAIAILVYGRTGSPFLTALAYALTYLPPIIGGPLLSGLADLFPRRRIMIACDLIRAVLVAGMAIPRVPFAALCALLFATVLLGAPFSSARSALLPDVLPGDKYVLGSAIGNITYQVSQIVGFVAGAAVVALLDPSRTLALDSLSFVLSALIVAAWVKRRSAPAGGQSERSSLWGVARLGAVLVFGNPMLRSLVLFGWLAGFYVITEGLAAPYAHALHGSTLDVGLIMAAMPAGTVVGAFAFGRLVTPSTRMRLMGWMAMLSCAPLLGMAANPPLWVVLALLAVSGVGGAYQLAAAAAFVQSVPDSGRARAFGLAQSGLLAAQGLGILAAGAAAQVIGPHVVIAVAGLLGLTGAILLTMGWTHQRAGVIASMRARAEAAQGD